MAKELLDKIRNAVDGPTDFKGQRGVEGFATILLTAFYQRHSEGCLYWRVK